MLRKCLFRLDAEKAHHVTLTMMWLLQRVRCIRPLIAGMPRGTPVKVAGLVFPNRLGLAAGLDKAAHCADAFTALGFGFVEVGTLTPRAQPGNPRPRLFRLIDNEAIINRMGFNNPGIEAGMAHVAKQRIRGILGVNLGKNFDTPNEHAMEDYVRGFRVAATRADYVAVNLSSPNTQGLRDLQTAIFCKNLILRLRQEREECVSDERRVPIFIKIAPDLPDEMIDALADVFLSEGLDGVIATNTMIGRDGVSGCNHAAEVGGLSGTPLRKRATEVVARLRVRLGVDFPIIAAGGIMTGADAREKLDAGAQLVQIYTGFIYKGPKLMEEILRLK